MDRNQLLKAVAEAVSDAQNRCVEILRQYLQSVGGSVDVSFRMFSCQNDTYIDESIPSIVELSRVYIDISSGKDEVCVTTANDGENWLITEYLTIDEMISLIDCITLNNC